MKVLFKYMSEPRTFFKDGFIRLSQPSVLNDPFEAAYCVNSLNDLANHFDDSSTYDSQLGEISFSDYIQNKMHNIGVICFSESKDNLLMWAHYSDEHRGIAAGVIDANYNGGIFHNLFRADSLINTAWEGYSPFDGIPKPVRSK